MLTEAQREKIKSAYQTATLKVRSVSPEGSVEWKRIENVIRNEVPWEHIVEVSVTGNTMVLTGGHPVYIGLTLGHTVKAENLRPGDLVLSVVGDTVVYLPVHSVSTLPSRQYMYDLTVEDWHRFVSAKTNVTISNSPDRNYHFRPPEAEGNIGAYNRVFGYVWLDNELNEYLERGLDWWNMMPPNTAGLNSINRLVMEKPEWRTAVLWEAITHACFALATNWVADEFSVKSNTYVRVALPDGRKVEVPIGELYELCHGPDVLDATRAAIREAYRAGTLKVEAVDPATGAASLQTVTAVLQHRTPHKDMVRVTLADDRWVECTVDHSLFTMAGEGVTPVLAGELRVGSVIATVSQGVAVGVEVASVVALPPEEHTYDLSVPGPQNFVLANGILAHNSYSIGGISLDIEKSSKYESLKQNAEGQFDKAAEAKARTVKFMRGIQQPKYGVGIRSAFGPNVGRGVLSPRGFL